jgi:hypothetical protein
MITGDFISTPGDASPMRIKELIPNDNVRAKALSHAAALGFQAREDGICVHFEAKDLKVVAKLLEVARLSGPTSESEDN